ncbi:hypothetical protein Tco_1163968 [Tanacetum coccineum]
MIFTEIGGDDISCDMIPPGIDTDDDSEGDVSPFEEPLDDVLFPLPKVDILPFKVEPVEERIERTKRSKNSQKPTRNERDKNKNEEIVKDQSRISRYSKKKPSEVPRTNYDKCLKFQKLIWSFEDQGTKVAK